MMPPPDDPHEFEPPMTRAGHSGDADGPSGLVGDPDRTQDDTKRMKSSIGLSEFGPGSVGQSTAGTSMRGVSGRIEPGQVLYSKYHVIRKLGGGAMGDVWLVRHAAMDDLHALKLIVANIASNEVALRRFQREFKVMASLKHHHAVQIYDACVDDDGGYIDMEYVDGRTIHDVLAAARSHPDRDPSGPLMPPDWIVRILDQLTDVLQEAHEKGIVHRDLKPSNLMILDGRKPGRESLKVLDFGIAKIRDDPDNAANMTLTQGFIGTPSYGSPEQAMNRQDIDGRADIYSVGVMLYEMVTGRLPFKGVHFQVMHQHATMPPPPFLEANPGLRPVPELEYAILRTLSKDRDKRQQTARDLFDEIAQAIADIGGPMAPAPPDSTWNTPRRIPTGSELAEPKTETDGSPFAAPIGHDTLTNDPTDPDPTKPPADSSSAFGGAIEPKRWTWKVLLGAAALGLIFAACFFAYKSGKLGVVAGDGVHPPSPSLSGSGPQPPRPISRVIPPDGYVEPQDVKKDADGYPEKLLRDADDVAFNRFAPGIYLPAGYTPVDPSDLVDGWPRHIIRDTDATRARFVRIEGNREWIMGDRSATGLQKDVPAHRVLLRSGFYIQETEVTNGQFEDFIRRNKKYTTADWSQAYADKKKSDGTEIARLHPAVNISRKQALEYALDASGLLPTEAQWEYAAKSQGKDYRYVWGDKATSMDFREMANVNSQNEASTSPVGKFPKDVTEQGVLGMTGNVREMCRDVWKPYRKLATAAVDPVETMPDESPPLYAIRGGDASSLPEMCGTTFRDDKLEDNGFDAFLGFRLVVDCPDLRPPH